jgi:hypothetical protein
MPLNYAAEATKIRFEDLLNSEFAASVWESWAVGKTSTASFFP